MVHMQNNSLGLPSLYLAFFSCGYADLITKPRYSFNAAARGCP